MVPHSAITIIFLIIIIIKKTIKSYHFSYSKVYHANENKDNKNEIETGIPQLKVFSCAKNKVHVREPHHCISVRLQLWKNEDRLQNMYQNFPLSNNFR